MTILPQAYLLEKKIEKNQKNQATNEMNKSLWREMFILFGYKYKMENLSNLLAEFSISNEMKYYKNTMQNCFSWLITSKPQIFTKIGLVQVQHIERELVSASSAR